MVTIAALDRDRIENVIETLVALLDEIDGDPNPEDNGDYERSPGGRPVCTALGIAEDCELDESDDEPDFDNEIDTPEWDGSDPINSATANLEIGGAIQ
jgi:hypothetical protein